MAIKNNNRKFFVEVFSPKHDWKYLGRIASFTGTEFFITHIKDPSKHFYIKEQGYPVNKELLEMLKNAGIRLIMIPQNGKTGFTAFWCEIDLYLLGITIQEPRTETQMVVPLKYLKETDKVDLEMIKEVHS